MIAMYGFEHEAIIQFAELMENRSFTDEMLTTIVNAHLMTKVLEENNI
jgi:nucleoside diphosphate kinase